MTTKRPGSRFEIWAAWAVLVMGVVHGCVLAPKATDSKVIGRDRNFIVVSPGAGETLRSLAAAYLGDGSKDWVIAEFNGIKRIKAGQEVVIPRRPTNRAGVFPKGFVKVPILTYHRFAKGNRVSSRLEVSERAFSRQMAYLKKHGYRVITLSDLADFLDGKGAIPSKSVILTIDDGFRSTYHVAYPILKKHGFSATVFVYTDFIGAPAGLTWAQMKEMVASGLIDIQPHSKTHADLTLRERGEDDTAYRERILTEVRNPARAISKNLNLPIHSFSYPYGAVNDVIIEAVQAEDYRLATTVTSGGNPSFAHPFVLRRSQIYGDDNLKTFAKRLDSFQRIAQR